MSFPLTSEAHYRFAEATLSIDSQEGRTVCAMFMYLHCWNGSIQSLPCRCCSIRSRGSSATDRQRGPFGVGPRTPRGGRDASGRMTLPYELMRAKGPHSAAPSYRAERETTSPAAEAGTRERRNCRRVGRTVPCC